MLGIPTVPVLPLLDPLQLPIQRVQAGGQLRKTWPIIFTEIITTKLKDRQRRAKVITLKHV